MPTLKAIRRRIASVKSTQQITRAMKLVAAARLRRAQEALTNAAPYHEAVKEIASSLLASEPSLLAPPPESHPAALMIVVGSDRGQCGGYNANLLREAQEQAQRMGREGLEVRMFAVGRKVLDHLRRENQRLVGDRINNVPKLAAVALARELAARALADYRAGEVREASIVYSHFRSALSQRPTFERLLPVELPGERAEAPVDYLIEPSRAELIPMVLKSYLESTVFHALLEAEASEQGARMTAMDNATNNAGEMIEQLTLDMNRARQAAITRELMDIVGGAEALRGAAR
jgi:F-type H+-transporting ATPase subunit gamma